MTEEEYLELDRTSLEKHELVDGEVLAMSGVSVAHDRLQGNLTVALASSDHVDGVVRILDHEIPLDELYEDVQPG